MSTTTSIPAVGETIELVAVDGTIVTHERTGTFASIVSRHVRGRLVWGQAFTPEFATGVVDKIVANPENYVRESLAHLLDQYDADLDVPVNDGTDQRWTDLADL